MGLSVRFDSRSDRVFDLPCDRGISVVRFYAGTPSPAPLEISVTLPSDDAPAKGDSGRLAFEADSDFIEGPAEVAKVVPITRGDENLSKVEFRCIAERCRITKEKG